MKAIQFPYAIKSFIGFLEGTQKSANTIKNYRLDLLAFQDFMRHHSRSSKSKDLSDITQADLESYHGFLRKNKFKTNTRRRKLLTIKRFLRYHTRRKKLPLDVSVTLLAPEKVERIPYTVPIPHLISKIKDLHHGTEIDARNRVLLWILAETGCLVSEITQLKFQDCRNQQIHFVGKAARELRISDELFYAIESLQTMSIKKSPYLFLGFNKFGSMGSPITARGVEMLVRLYAPRLGFPPLTPRTFRHSAVLFWYHSKVKTEEIKNRLGLKTQYAFRVYSTLFKSSSSATST